MIEIRELKFSYPSSTHPVLQISQFSISEGERVFLHGPSGSGKTTLLGLLGGVLLPSPRDIGSGSQLKILGQDMLRLSPSARDQFRADHIGLIFQTFNLIPYLSVIENVLLPLRFSKKKNLKISGDPRSEASRLLKHMQLSEENWVKPVHQLSVGQQQRVAAARGLLGQPEILIADEPTSALDESSRTGFLQLLFEECSRARSTLIFVSHDGRLKSMFERIVDLKSLGSRGSGAGGTS